MCFLLADHGLCSLPFGSEPRQGLPGSYTDAATAAFFKTLETVSSARCKYNGIKLLVDS